MVSVWFAVDGAIALEDHNDDHWECLKIASASEVTIVMNLIFNLDETLMA